MGSSPDARVWYGVGSNDTEHPFNEQKCRALLNARKEDPESYEDWECADEILAEYNCRVVRYGYHGDSKGIAIKGTYQMSPDWECAELVEIKAVSADEKARLIAALDAIGWCGDRDPKWLFAGCYG